MAAVNPIPEGFQTLSPYLIVKDVAAAIEFYKQGFGATEIHRQLNHEGKLNGAELMVGTSPMMLGQHPDMQIDEPSLQNVPQVTLYLYVADADGFFERAVSAGAKVLMPLDNKFYGNREGGIADPFGIVWWVASRIEIVPPEEFPVRARAATQQREAQS